LLLNFYTNLAKSTRKNGNFLPPLRQVGLGKIPYGTLTFLAPAPYALVLADARAPALLACAPSALVRADACAPTLLACAPSALVRADAYAHRAIQALLLGGTFAWLRCHPSPATLPLPFRPAFLLGLALRRGPRFTAHLFPCGLYC
jgi:hypothetical protein